MVCGSQTTPCGSQTTPGKEVGGMEEVHFPLLLLMYICTCTLFLFLCHGVHEHILDLLTI